MTRVIRGVLEAPTVLRLEEPVPLPLHVALEVTISGPAAADEGAASTLLSLADTLRVDGPADFSERWEAYVAEDERERER